MGVVASGRWVVALMFAGALALVLAFQALNAWT